jgi:hypothetical protein
MKKMIIAAVILVSAFVVGSAQAENFVWADENYRTVTQVYPDTDFQFYLDGDTIDTASSCANRFVIRHTDPNYNVKVATLLTAWETDRTVRVMYDADDTSCGTDISMFKIQ